MRSGYSKRFSGRCLTVSLLLFLCHAHCALSDEPAKVAWYVMDEIIEESGTRRIADASGNGRYLLVGEGCSITNAADIGNAVYFDGTQKAWGCTDDTLSFPAPGARSISMWLYRESTDGPLDPTLNKIPYLFTSMSTLYVNWVNGQNALRSCAGSPDICVSYSSVPSRGKWHHVAWVFEVTEEIAPGTNSLCNLNEYLDGELVRAQTGVSVPGSLSKLSKADKLNLGNNVPSGVRPLFGALKDVRLYAAALSAADVKAQYIAGLNARPTLLCGRWPMEETAAQGSDTVIVPAQSAMGAYLKTGAGAELVDGGVSGKCAWFPDVTTAWMVMPFPLATPGFSFGMWLKFGTDLTNAIPHIYSMGKYGRACLEGSSRGMFDNRAHFFDVGTFNDPNDQGFWCPYVTVQKGKWSHFGVTYTMALEPASNLYAVTPRIYVDGVCVCTGRTQTAAALTGVFPEITQFSLGNYGANGVRPFGGWMDDFCWFNGVLSEEQMKDLAAGMPSVSAGEDFTVAAETARLNGTVGLTGTLGNRKAAKTTAAWSLVAAPAGGEGASIMQAGDLRTSVTLPVTGEYTFRLTAVSLYGGVESDDVTVTRMAVPPANQPPAVSVSGAAAVAAYVPAAFTATASDPDEAPGTLRVSWKKVSGPGAVRFEPAQGVSTKATFFTAGEYQIAAVASDGAAETVATPVTVTVAASEAINLESGLIAHWPFEIGRKERVNGTAYTVDRSNVIWERGVDDYAIRVNGAFYPYFDTDMTLLETEDPALATTPIDRYRAFSCWIYHDTADTNNSSHAAIIAVPFTLGLWYNCENGTRGFTMYQQTLQSWCSGLGNLDVYGRPEVDPADRWTHVYALFDRRTNYLNSTSELWIDGVKQTNRTTHGMGGGRVLTNKIMIGGHMSNGVEGNNGHFKDEGGNYLSRTFPGVIDEMRMYNRALTEAEIKYLAASPVTEITRAPAVGGEPAQLSSTARVTKEISVQVNADTYPPGAVLTYTWCVLSGDTSKIVFGDVTARTTTLTALETGTYVIQLAVSDGERTVYSAPIPLDVHASGTVIYLR